MEKNNIRPLSLDSVSEKQNFCSDRNLMERAQMLAGGMISAGAQMNNTDNYKVIPIDKLVEFSEHPFRVRDDMELEELAESIKESGVIEAILVRPAENGKYEILAGHRRVAASKKIGNHDILAKILNVDDNEAAIIMTNTNLKRRERILPSERARSYKIQMEAYKNQGKRNDLINFVRENIDLCSNWTQVEDMEQKDLCSNWTQVKSRDIVAQMNKTSALQVTRHLRLNELIKELLNLVDKDEIPFNAGVALSFLNTDEQKMIVNAMENGIIKKIDLKTAEALKSLSKEGQLNDTTLSKMFIKSEEKTSITAYATFENATKKALKHFKKTNYTAMTINQGELEQIIISAITNYIENIK